MCFPYGSDKPNEIYTCCHSAENFYKMSVDEMLALGFLSEKDVRVIKHTSIFRAEKILIDLENIGGKVVSIDDDKYPKRLRMIYGPPAVIYYKGDIDGVDDNVVIGIVGTRRATQYTADATTWIASDLAKAGAIIVSGCAVGIDAAAHFGALKGNGKTIGVLACSLDTNYPAENEKLKEKMISRGGAVITEIPPKTEMPYGYFPTRNRLIAGLSLGVLIAHAPVRSGALLTAEHALEQGKEIYCLPPYSVLDVNAMGVMKYIRDGSTVIACAEDILIDFYYGYADKLERNKIVGDYIDQKIADEGLLAFKKIAKEPKEKVNGKEQNPKKPEAESESGDEGKKYHDYEQRNQEIIDGLDERSRQIYDILGITPKFVDEISNEIGQNVAVVLGVLTELEILGLAASFGGKRYALNI